MVIRGRAPLRVSFGGGGTDVAPFCEEQGGAIIGSTINKYAYCSIVPREDDQIVVHSLDFDMTVKYNTRENYVYDGKLDLVTAALNAMGIDSSGPRGLHSRHVWTMQPRLRPIVQEGMLNAGYFVGRRSGDQASQCGERPAQANGVD